MVFATDVAYGFGVLRWMPSPSLQLQPGLVANNVNHPALAEARKVKALADFLYWSRLPLAKVEEDASGTILTITDARYSKGAAAGQFTRTLRLPAQAKLPALPGAQSNPPTGD
jgi:hypothetical protein